MTMRRKCLAVFAAALALVTMLSAPASAAPVACAAPAPSTTHPGYLVLDPACDVSGAAFTPLTGAHIWTGIRDGAAFRFEVPQQWNGKLVVYAHGYRGTGNVVYVDNPALRAHYLETGYAWAASSYATNGYDVGQGVRDSHALIDIFRQVTGRPARSVIMTGASMGGQVTAVAIERFPRAFDAAMPYCGVLGDTELYDYFLDANVTAAALTDERIDFPLAPGADYQAQWREQAGRITAALGVKAGTLPVLTRAGKNWSNAVERRSGGERPGFDSAFAYWNAAPSLAPLNDLPFLFGLYPGLSGGTGGIASGNVTDNQYTYYRLADSPLPTFAELKLNAEVLRVQHTATADPGLAGIPRVNGTPRIPVLSLHDVGDLFVPFSMEQEYARRALRNGRANLFVSRAIRGVGHCDFTQSELVTAFDDLTAWVRTGRRPAGDAILNSRAVADESFGCRFTDGAHPGYVASPCPAKTTAPPAPPRM
ncbi:alpha/beta hydrolase family protein [Actinoplanes sp. NPDC020271]|uniref:alpha/beta hydrolase family protein n=1 Tax=Actinoplanes sp. NPDC020271 TaxID=3363896 RepID=UPI00379C2626